MSKGPTNGYGFRSNESKTLTQEFLAKVLPVPCPFLYHSDHCRTLVVLHLSSLKTDPVRCFSSLHYTQSSALGELYWDSCSRHHTGIHEE